MAIRGRVSALIVLFAGGTFVLALLTFVVLLINKIKR
ncbi:putative holin-like toxin [Lacticaseibacillus songhuajiangensis]